MDYLQCDSIELIIHYIVLACAIILFLIILQNIDDSNNQKMKESKYNKMTKLLNYYRNSIDYRKKLRK